VASKLSQVIVSTWHDFLLDDLHKGFRLALDDLNVVLLENFTLSVNLGLAACTDFYEDVALFSELFEDFNE